MSTKSRRRKARRAFLKQANQICAIVDAEIMESVERAAQQQRDKEIRDDSTAIALGGKL